jgi:hypothetical protein
MSGCGGPRCVNFVSVDPGGLDEDGAEDRVEGVAKEVLLPRARVQDVARGDGDGIRAIEPDLGGTVDHHERLRVLPVQVIREGVTGTEYDDTECGLRSLGQVARPPLSEAEVSVADPHEVGTHAGTAVSVIER